MTIKNTPINLVRLGKRKKFWLLVIVIALIAVHLNVISKYGSKYDSKNLLGISVIFWTAVLFLLWKKRDHLKVDSDTFSNVLGAFTIVFVLCKSILIPDNPLLQITPFLSAVGLGLIASGFKGIKQYSQELILLFVLGIPFEAVISNMIDLAHLTAQFVTTILWYLGFEVSQQGVNIIFPTGAIEVSPYCSGLKVVVRMLRLAILFVVIFPSNWLKNILVPVVAVSIGFIGNAVRVGVLAIIVVDSNHKLFEYFHGPGGHIFTTISVLVFGLFCYFVVEPNKLEN